MGDLPLAAGIPARSREDWEEAATAALAGRPLTALTSTLPGGLSVEPLYSRAIGADRAGLPGSAPHVRGTRGAGHVDGGWDIRQRHVEPDPVVANEQVLADLERGVTSVELDGDAMGIGSAAALDAVLRDVHLDLAPVAFRPHAGQVAAHLLDLAERRPVPPSTLLGELGQDPLGAGVDPGPGIELALRVAESHQAVRTFAADGCRFDSLGADVPTQLATVLADGVAVMRLLDDAGLAPVPAAGQIVLHVAVGQDQFLSLAAVRALRRCWARVLDACGATGAIGGVRIHATASETFLTRRDPWVNLLRSTSACFAAAAGGADGVTVLPFDAAVGRPDELGRRLARNTQLILRDESGVHRVVDPGGGSWYVEALTDQVAAAAWERLQAIEAAGGFVAARSDIDRWVDDSWQATLEATATRRRPLTGVTEFPPSDEAPLERQPGPPPPGRRPSAPFEDLVAAARCADPAPRVFLANLGSIAQHTARAGFATNLFVAGGIDVVGNDGFDDPGALAETFRAAATPLACICSSDAVYDEWAAGAAAALRAAGAAEVWLAGRASVDGIDRNIVLGGDAVDDLTRAHDVLGVTR